MLHGVVNVSDITAADGRALDQFLFVSNAFVGKRNDHIWPSQHHVVSSDYVHFGGRQWNSFSHITSTCVNLWATGSSSQIPNGPTIGIGFCWQITKEMRPCFSQIISLLIFKFSLVFAAKEVWLELPIRRKLTNDSKYIWI
jgi:hypothetical protein